MNGSCGLINRQEGPSEAPSCCPGFVHRGCSLARAGGCALPGGHVRHRTGVLHGAPARQPWCVVLSRRAFLPAVPEAASVVK